MSSAYESPVLSTVSVTVRPETADGHSQSNDWGVEYAEVTLFASLTATAHQCVPLASHPVGA